MSSFAVILAAAGYSRRFGDETGKKTLVSLRGKPVWFHSAEKFTARADVQQLIVVVGADDRVQFEQAHGELIRQVDATIVVGGKERMDSVFNGLAKVNDNIDFVVIHDGARPCVSCALIEDTFDAVVSAECVIPAEPVSSTVKRSADGGKTVAETVDRNELFLAQTPQVFSRELLIDLFRRYHESDSLIKLTDEAQLAEQFGVVIHLVQGCPMNIKLTNPIDLQVADAYLSIIEEIRFDAPSCDGGRRLS